MESKTPNMDTVSAPLISIQEVEKVVDHAATTPEALSHKILLTTALTIATIALTLFALLLFSIWGARTGVGQVLPFVAKDEPRELRLP